MIIPTMASFMYALSLGHWSVSLGFFGLVAYNAALSRVLHPSQAVYHIRAFDVALVFLFSLSVRTLRKAYRDSSVPLTYHTGSHGRLYSALAYVRCVG